MATEAYGAAEAPSGMPQLDPSTFTNQIFWLVVTLVVIYLILSRVALPRIGAVLAERQGAITNDLAAAEDLKRQAAQAEAAYDKALSDARAEAQEIIAQARAEIQADLAEATAKADAQIAERTAQSEARINEIRAGAMASVETVAKDTAAEIVAAFSGGKSDAAAVNAAVAQRLRGANQ